MSEKQETEKKLKILHHSENFVVVDKPFDVIINSEEADRVSVHSLMREQFPHLTNKNLKVSCIIIKSKTKLSLIGACERIFRVNGQVRLCTYVCTYLLMYAIFLCMLQNKYVTKCSIFVRSNKSTQVWNFKNQFQSQFIY